jgi:hypothetical protein
MLFTIKRAIARNIGKNYELCKPAFEEGREQGRILLAKYDEKKSSNKVEDPVEDTTQYSYRETTTNPM